MKPSGKRGVTSASRNARHAASPTPRVAPTLRPKTSSATAFCEAPPGQDGGAAVMQAERSGRAARAARRRRMGVRKLERARPFHGRGPAQPAHRPPSARGPQPRTTGRGRRAATEWSAVASTPPRRRPGGSFSPRPREGPKRPAFRRAAGRRRRDRGDAPGTGAPPCQAVDCRPARRNAGWPCPAGAEVRTARSPCGRSGAHPLGRAMGQPPRRGSIVTD